MSEVQQGQSFLDKVTELTGTHEYAIEMALLNNVSITDDAVRGANYKTPAVTRTNVVNFFNAIDNPATDISSRQKDETADLGIGEMEIENTFIVR